MSAIRVEIIEKDNKFDSYATFRVVLLSLIEEDKKDRLHEEFNRLFLRTGKDIFYLKLFSMYVTLTKNSIPLTEKDIEEYKPGID